MRLPKEVISQAFPTALKGLWKSSLMWEFFKETNTAPQRLNMWCLNCQNIDFDVLHPSRKKKFHTWKNISLLEIAQEFYSITRSCWRPHFLIYTWEEHILCHVSSVVVILSTLCTHSCGTTTIFSLQLFDKHDSKNVTSQTCTYLLDDNQMLKTHNY